MQPGREPATYEVHYGLSEKPFGLPPDLRFLYRSKSFAHGIDQLRQALDRGEGFVVVTGELGTGKTMLCRALIESTDPKTFIVLLANPFLSEEDLLKEILRDLGVLSRTQVGTSPEPSKQDLVNGLHDFLHSLGPLGAKAVLILDEAQNLPLSILEQIRVLSNLDSDRDRLLQIVLVGELELMTLLKSRDLRQLDQRISIRHHLKPLHEEEVGAYVMHRMAVANGKGAAFTPGALRLVHELTGGVPRLVNTLCDGTLRTGYSLQTHRLDEAMVTAAAEALDLKRVKPSRPSFLRQLFGTRRS